MTSQADPNYFYQRQASLGSVVGTVLLRLPIDLRIVRRIEEVERCLRIPVVRGRHAEWLQQRFGQEALAGHEGVLEDLRRKRSQAGTCS